MITKYDIGDMVTFQNHDGDTICDTINGIHVNINQSHIIITYNFYYSDNVIDQIDILSKLIEVNK